MDKKRALKYIYDKYKNAHCELNYQNDLELLIAIMLSAQTTDKKVNNCTKKLFLEYKTLFDYATADVDKLKSIIKSIGLANSKANNIILMAKKVLDDYDGIIPNNKKDLLSLRGVGNKTASVFLAEYYHMPYMGVDTHVSRVAKRLYLALPNDTPEVIEKKLEKLIAKTAIHEMHHRMIFFGRYHCKAKNPNCQNCEVSDICRYYKEEIKNGKRT